MPNTSQVSSEQENDRKTWQFSPRKFYEIKEKYIPEKQSILEAMEHLLAK